MRGRMLVVAVLVAGLAACGGGSSTSSSTGAQNVTADKAKAKAALLRLKDFPSGWTASGEATTSSGGNLDAFDEAMAGCLGVDTAQLRGSGASASSPDFESGDGQQVSHTVSMARDEAKAKATMDIFGKDEMPGCLADAFDTQIQKSMKPSSSDTLPPGVEIGKAEVAKADFPDQGDETIAYHASVPISYQNQKLDFGIDVVVIRKGRAGSVLLLMSQGGDFPKALAQDLAETSAGRLPA